MAKNYEGLLLALAAVAVPTDGVWFTVPDDAAEQLTAVFQITGGTGTLIIEGRMGPNDVGVQLDTTGATKVGLIPKLKQYRARLTAVTAAVTARVSLNRVLLDA